MKISYRLIKVFNINSENKNVINTDYEKTSY